MDSQTLTLGDLLAEKRFNLRMIAAPEGWEDRPVAGVHGTEVEHPVPWLGTNWVMLTMGLHLSHDPADQRRLVDELHEGGIAALGFGTGMAFDEVPEAILDAARRHGFPVFEAPLNTPFNQVSAFAARSLVSGDIQMLRRQISVQNYLMDSLQAASPEEEIVRRLGSSLDGVIALFLSDGKLEALYRRAQAQIQPEDEAWAGRIWAEIQSREPTFQRFTLDDGMVISTPVGTGEDVRYWLTAATSLEDSSGSLARPVLEAAGRILAVVVTSRRLAASRERAERAQLLNQMLKPGAKLEDKLPRTAAALGLEAGAPARGVALARRVPGSAASFGLEDAAGERCEQSWATAKMPFIAAPHDEALYAVVQAPPEALEASLCELCAELDAVAGLGRSIEAPDDLPATLADARLALREVTLRGAKDPLLRFEDVSIASWLLSQSPPEEVAAKAAGTIGALADKPVLHETLASYMSYDLDVSKTARALHLHPNSLRYRLAKIEDLIGESLSRPATIANLYLAMLLDTDNGDD